MRISPVSPILNQSKNVIKKQVDKKNNFNNSAMYSTPEERFVNNISFGNNSIIKKTSSVIEENLKTKYNIEAFFANNDLVANCAEKTANLFAKYFGEKSLPDQLGFAPFDLIFPSDSNSDDILGIHHSKPETKKNTILFNSNSRCFDSILNLKKNEFYAKISWFHPSAHYLQTFVHEFGHSAHYKNLLSLEQENVMDQLRETKLTGFSKFITMFSLGSYAADNMNEFMAERITKDICKNLDKNGEFIGNEKNLNYSTIFSERWLTTSTPQALLDYFTQCVWNGNRAGADSAFDKMKDCVLKYEKKAEPVAKYKQLLKVCNQLLEDDSSFNKHIEEVKAEFKEKKGINLNSKMLKLLTLFLTSKEILSAKEEAKKILDEAYADKLTETNSEIPFLDNFIFEEVKKNYNELQECYESLKKVMELKYNKEFLTNPKEAKKFETQFIMYLSMKEIKKTLKEGVYALYSKLKESLKFDATVSTRTTGPTALQRRKNDHKHLLPKL